MSVCSLMLTDVSLIMCGCSLLVWSICYIILNEWV